MRARGFERVLLIALASATACAEGLAAPRDADVDTADVDTAGSDAPPMRSAALALAHGAVSADGAHAEACIARLRAAGPAGHRALLEAHAEDVALLRASPPAVLTPQLERLRHAIDVVSGQRDGHASGLYWFTDLALAQAEARATGRPILALRLLGELDEELSCANSRYFRVLLYADARVRDQLAEDFVLFWSSERPAPHITIDMGDGRTIERTITGNSVHYVMDASGRVVDGIPGLYTASDFADRLREARAIATECGSLGEGAFVGCVASRHRAALMETEARWSRMLADDASLPSWTALADARLIASGAAPSAVEAMRTTMAKDSVEMPMLDLMQAGRARPAPRVVVDWMSLGARVGAPALGEESLALLRLKTGTSDVSELAAQLSASAAADSLRNEVTMHRVIHEWLADEESGATEWARLNERVYTEIFLTPASDPWLGLRAEDLWDAIESAGR
jgi:hypothetical protein